MRWVIVAGVLALMLASFEMLHFGITANYWIYSWNMGTEYRCDPRCVRAFGARVAIFRATPKVCFGFHIELWRFSSGVRIACANAPLIDKL